jgi:hypothetical protein
MFGGPGCLGCTGDVTLIDHLVAALFKVFNELINHRSLRLKHMINDLVSQLNLGRSLLIHHAAFRFSGG